METEDVLELPPVNDNLLEEVEAYWAERGNVLNLIVPGRIRTGPVLQQFMNLRIPARFSLRDMLEDIIFGSRVSLLDREGLTLRHEYISRMYREFATLIRHTGKDFGFLVASGLDDISMRVGLYKFEVLDYDQWGINPRRPRGGQRWLTFPKALALMAHLSKVKHPYSVWFGGFHWGNTSFELLYLRGGGLKLVYQDETFRDAQGNVLVPDQVAYELQNKRKLRDRKKHRHGQGSMTVYFIL
ncbi:MAG TPA: hypothetical protein VEA59_06770 [Patescibacteria group bacterium]|nr:hypothetical protein [Patescibacteria group bacterium]